MRKLMTAVAMTVALTGLPTAPGTAWAQKNDAAFRDLVKQAMEHYNARQYAQAIEKFEAAYAIQSKPELIYNIARAYEKSLKSDQAVAAYERFLALPGTTADLRAKALDSLRALRAEKKAIENVNQAGTGQGATGGTVSRPPPEPKSRTLEWALIGGGAAIAATGAVFGVLALGANSDFEAELDKPNPSRVVLEDKQSSANTNALLADVLIGVGVVSAGAGIIMMLAGGDDGGQNVAVSPAFGPDLAGVAFSGRF